jgi:competence protein ComEC
MPERPASPNFSNFPLFFIATVFAVGIGFAPLVDADVNLPLITCAGLGLIAILLRSRRAATPLILLAFFTAGISLSMLEKRSVSPDRLRAIYDSGAITSGDAVEIEGVLAGRPEPMYDGAILNVRARKIMHRGTERQVSGSVRFFVPNSPATEVERPRAELKYGSRVRVTTQLQREEAFLNPGVMSRVEMLDRMRFDATGSIKSAMMIEHVADESVFIPLVWVYDRRVRLIEAFRANLGQSAAGVMIASLLGNKHFLDKETADLFRDGGTFHILVISGLHITFIGGLLLWILRRVTRNRWLQFGVTNAILWAYTLAVGADVPVVRAAVMFLVLSFSYAIYRKHNLLNSFGLCALVLLAWRPSDLFNPSFQLTFVSVGAIVGFGYPLIEKMRKIGAWTPSAETPFPPNVPSWLKRLCERLYWRPESWAIRSKREMWSASLFKSERGLRFETAKRSTVYIFEAVLISFIVQLAMLPLLVVYFHRVSLPAILLNIWVGIFITIESFAAVIGAAAGSLSRFAGAGFFAVAETANWLMLALPRVFSSGDWASIRLPHYSGNGRVLYVAYAIVIIFAAYAANRWRPFALGKQPFVTSRRAISAATFAGLVLAGIIIFHPFSAPRPDGRLRFDFLDVGQGDATLVTFPNGATMLVDGGGRINYREAEDAGEAFVRDEQGVGETVVSAFLWHRGYAELDYIVATHADTDHIQGLGDVVRNFDVDEAIVGRIPPDDPEFNTFMEAASRSGTPVARISRGDRIEIAGVTVEVLSPPDGDVATRARSANNDSVVLRFVHGTRSFLLAGDIEKEGELELLKYAGSIAADVIKVEHHGSRTSSTPEFVAATRASLAIIPVGRSSPFGHPHPEVVKRWTATGASVMTTGERGTISVSTNGHDIAVETFKRKQ